MDLMQAIEERHAVRSYRDKPLSHEAVARLEKVIARCNAEGGSSLPIGQRMSLRLLAARLIRHVQRRT